MGLLEGVGYFAGAPGQCWRQARDGALFPHWDVRKQWRLRQDDGLSALYRDVVSTERCLGERGGAGGRLRNGFSCGGLVGHELDILVA